MAEFSMTFRNQEVWHVRKAKPLLMSSFILLLSKSDHIISLYFSSLPTLKKQALSDAKNCFCNSQRATAESVRLLVVVSLV